MKSKVWIILLAVILVLSAVLSVVLLAPGEAAAQAEIYSDGKLIKTVNLFEFQEFTVTTPDGGVNTVTVQGGKIAVTQANCPDSYCMARGYCNAGAQIVCLPNRLVIRFAGQQEIDAAVG